MAKSNRHSFEATARRMADGYPTLFRTRLDILDHLFVVIGNGYRWVNGALDATGFTWPLHATWWARVCAEEALAVVRARIEQLYERA